MLKRRARSRATAPGTSSAQIPLPIGIGQDSPVDGPARLLTRRRRYGRELDMDPILYMPDVVRLVGRHRSTILRWIDRQWFPAKSVPSEHPTGWLRSEIEKWQRGQRDLPAGEREGAPDQRSRESPTGSSVTE
jgi:predicted DNA-binding transcriptional regulator AlpA